jgi:hypothetical protein
MNYLCLFFVDSMIVIVDVVLIGDYCHFDNTDKAIVSKAYNNRII